MILTVNCECFYDPEVQTDKDAFIEAVKVASVAKDAERYFGPNCGILTYDELVTALRGKFGDVFANAYLSAPHDVVVRWGC